MTNTELVELYVASDNCLHIPTTNNFYVINIKNVPHVKMYERGTEAPVKVFKFNPQTYKRKLREISESYLYAAANRRAAEWY